MELWIRQQASWWHKKVVSLFNALCSVFHFKLKQLFTKKDDQCSESKSLLNVNTLLAGCLSREDEVVAFLLTLRVASENSHFIHIASFVLLANPLEFIAGIFLQCLVSTTIETAFYLSDMETGKMTFTCSIHIARRWKEKFLKNYF